MEEKKEDLKINEKFKLERIYQEDDVRRTIYKIVINAFCPYRGIQITSPLLSDDEFIKNMQYDLSIKIEGVKDGIKYHIVILDSDVDNANELVQISDKFKSFIHIFSEGKILIISPCPVKKHVQRLISMLPNKADIFIYRYDNFKIVVPLGPYCSDQEVLSYEESRIVLQNEKKIDPIFQDDPQIIWSGGEIGQVVKITRISEAVGRELAYRIIMNRPDVE